jgi:hypothetical protein
MAGLLDFAARFGAEERCIEHLAGLRWPGGFVCSGCGGRAAWRLKARPRVYECVTCHRQESVTAGTVFHRTRAKHLPRYLREWSYRFNRRNLPDGLDGYLIRRAVECTTITYRQLKTGTMPGGANRVRRPPAPVAQPALPG